MKYKILTIIAIIIANTLVAKSSTFFSDISIQAKYSSNILKLSQYDLDKFDNGDESGKFEIETSDDFIVSPRLEMGWKNYLFAGHTQIVKVSFDYNKYQQNEIKDGITFGLNLKQYLNKKVNFTLGYMYSPDIYVNRYKSVLGDVLIYRDFTYSKNYYYGRIHYKFFPNVITSYRLGASQLFYNEYFTEYDAFGWQHLFNVRFLPTDCLQFDLKYEFKTSAAQSEDAFEFPEDISVIKDGSYDSNKYSVGIEFPKINLLDSKEISFQIEAQYEERFFQSAYVDDEYHFARDDYIFSIKPNFEMNLNKNIKFQMNGNYEQRNTDSPFSVIERDKEYELFEFGVILRHSF
jgi:hypothetical protein